MDIHRIKSIAIYPAIGIARIGNSPQYYLASDIPGKAPVPDGGFKDESNQLKKQVPLFRIYGLDDQHKPVGEITADLAEIEWHVHVANRKAAWYQFNNAMDLGEKSIPSTKRNGGVRDVERQSLINDPGVRTINGINKAGELYQFVGGTCFGIPVSLGEIRTDEKGRLLVFGGNGSSASAAGTPALTFANNDGWYDDTSDGTVRAFVQLNGIKMEAKPAVVICTPPNFGPGLFPIVTMYDVVYDLYVRKELLPKPKQIDFYQDIYPILSRISTTQWVNEGFFILFGTNSPSDFTNPDLLKRLSNPADDWKSERMRLFNWFRSSTSPDYEPSKLPPHYGDLFGDYGNLPQVDLSVTATQYEALRRWAEGDFKTGKLAEVHPFEEMNPEQQVAALLKAPLTECLGGPFHPGIEITWTFRQLLMWDEPFRLKVLPENVPVIDDYGPMLTAEIAMSAGGPLDGCGPGSTTRWLGIPWQTDGASCLSGYDTTLYLPLPSFWSVRVPNTVLSMDSFQRATKEALPLGQRLKHFSYRVDWLRDFPPAYVSRINKMVSSWYQLGVISPATGMTQSPDLPTDWWVETDRAMSGGQDPTFQQVLQAENEAASQLSHADILGILPLAAEPFETKPRQSRPLKRHEL